MEGGGFPEAELLRELGLGVNNSLSSLACHGCIDGQPTLTDHLRLLGSQRSVEDELARESAADIPTVLVRSVWLVQQQVFAVVATVFSFFCLCVCVCVCVCFFVSLQLFDHVSLRIDGVGTPLSFALVDVVHSHQGTPCCLTLVGQYRLTDDALLSSSWGLLAC